MNMEGMKQRGFIMKGGGIDIEEWVRRAQSDGFVTVDHESHVELWNQATKAELASEAGRK